MLSKEDRKARNSLFWDDFRKRMRSISSSNGRRINWINYPSDVKYIFIRMELDNKGVKLCFDIQPKDDGIRAILWEQMNELKKVLESEMNWETKWTENYQGVDGRLISRISWENETLNFYNDEDWEDIYDFLRERLIEFDTFYQEFKEILITLAE